MPKFSEVLEQLQVGELIFTRWPPGGVQPAHVTIPYNGRNQGMATSYVHAWSPSLEIANLDTYVQFKGFGGFLRFEPIDRTYAEAVAGVAARFAGTTARTPYGSYPNKDDFAHAGVKTKERQNASRYDGMLAAMDVQQEQVDVRGDLSFQFASLVRLVKWTGRYLSGQ